MEIGEIFGDALKYPFNNILALIVYAILGIILGIAVGLTLVPIAASIALKNQITIVNASAIMGTGIIGMIISLVIGFVISGYELDIVKSGIMRDENGPKLDFVRQFINGVKLFIVRIVYYIIPVIIAAVLAAIFQHWLSGLISIILFIIFAFAAFMGECRLAKTEDLGYALNIGQAIGDISRVGFLKLIIFIIAVVIIVFILSLIAAFVYKLNTTIGGIVIGIIGVYLVFVIGRATGLLYSDV